MSITKKKFVPDSIGKPSQQESRLEQDKFIDHPYLEPLEPRTLFSADIIGLAPADTTADTFDSEIAATLADNDSAIGFIEDSGNTTSGIELVFIDSTLPQHELIIEDLFKQKEQGRNIEVVLLDSDDQGIAVITETLAPLNNVAAIHIISHGTDSGVQLGDTWLSENTVDQYEADLQQWSESLSENADLLIYGCNLAASDEGLSLLDTLAEQTQADVAASSDTTGHDNLGANWTLEYTSGTIDHAIALSSDAQQAWEIELAASLVAVDDDLGPRPYNNEIDIGDASSNNDFDITSNDISDPGSAINLVNVLPAGNGTISANNDNTYTYEPDNDYLGPDSFDYIVTDGDNDIQHHWSLSDNANAIAVDETGRSDGAITGTSVVPGTPDFLEFDGNDFVSLAPIEYADSFTLSFDFKLGSTTDNFLSLGSEQFIDQGQFGFSDTTLPGTIGIWVGDTNNPIWANTLVTALKGNNPNDPPIEIEIPINGLVNDNQWHNYTLTIDSESDNSPFAEVFIDGNQFQPNSTFYVGQGGFTTNQNVFLGASNSIAPSFLDDHDFRDLRIYEGVKTVEAANQDVEYSTGTVNIDLQLPNIRPNFLNIDIIDHTILENSDPIVIADNVVFADPNVGPGDSHVGGTLSISRHLGSNPDDLFALSSGPLIEGNPLVFNGTTIGDIVKNSDGELFITFNDNSTTDLTNDFFRSITYQNSSETPDSNFDLAWVFNDGFSGPAELGEAKADTDRATINIIPTLDFEVVAPANIVVAEDNSFDLSTIAISSDLDNSAPLATTVRANNGTISVAGTNVTLIGNGTDELTLEGTESQINNALQTLSYLPLTNFHGNDTLNINVESTETLPPFLTAPPSADNSHDIIVEVVSVNDEPSGTNKQTTILEEQTFVFGVSDFGYSDIDPNQLDRVIIDTAPATGNLLLDSTIISAGDSVSAVDIQSGKLIFSPEENSNTPVEFTFSVMDNGGTDNGGVNIDSTPNTFDISITPVNDAPEGMNNTITLNEDTAYDFSSADFDFTDIDQNNLKAVIINTLPANGQLLLAGAAVAAGQSIDETAITNLQYLPAANSNGIALDSFDFQVQDSGGTVNGGIDLDATENRITIDVLPVNDAPMGADSNIAILEDTSHTLNLSDFGFSDSSDNDLLSSITIVNPPTTGTLTLAGAVVGSNTTIQPSDIDNQQLLYTPAANDNGLASDTIQFAVQDDGGTLNGGIDTDLTPNTITIDIDAVNDAPTGTDKTVTVPEDNTFDFNIADFGFSDTDNHTLLSVTISELPLNGQLVLSGLPVTTGQIIPAGAINSLQFTPAANDNGIGYDSLAFQVQDSGGTLNGEPTLTSPKIGSPLMYCRSTMHRPVQTKL